MFRLLAKGMDFTEPLFQETEAVMITQALDNPCNPYLNGISYESLVEQTFMKAQVKPIFPGTLETPSGKIELFSEKMKENGYPHCQPTYH